MSYTLNTTDNYHKNDLDSLGWELTVCNALYPAGSPCRSVLQSNKSFGALLFHFLGKFFEWKNINNILEIGGGMGNLMHDFLSLNPQLKATLLDISPQLLAKQKELLSDFAVSFWEKDILQIEADTLLPFDLVIMNENLGDLPTLVANPAAGKLSEETLSFLDRARYFIKRYRLDPAKNENINIGAWEVLEKLCQAGIKHIYLGEHSCEAVAPEYLKPYFYFVPSGNPEKISLRGHDEYTIKFSYLQKIAELFNYKIMRGPFTDFLMPAFNDKVRTALQSAVPYSAEQEIIQQFVYDIHKYEYLFLTAS